MKQVLIFQNIDTSSCNNHRKKEGKNVYYNNANYYIANKVS